MALLQHARSVAFRTYLWLYDLFQLKLVFDSVFRLFMGLVEMDVVPDFILRRGIRTLLKLRLKSVSSIHNYMEILSQCATPPAFINQHVSGCA